jgi:hypothetical protein
VKIADWIREDWEPAFATVEAWIHDQLGQAELQEEATYAYLLRPEKDPRGYAVRILVAADKGLADLTWERPNAVEQRVLKATYFGWHEVRGVRLTGETRIDPATLMHRAPTWGLRIEAPEVEIAEAVDDRALLEFWGAAMERIRAAST